MLKTDSDWIIYNQAMKALKQLECMLTGPEQEWTSSRVDEFEDAALQGSVWLALQTVCHSVNLLAKQCGERLANPPKGLGGV